jgi:hypothetical protein
MARRTIQAPRLPQWSAQVARDVLHRHLPSGLSLAAFADSIGCSVSRIQYRRHKLRAPPCLTRSGLLRRPDCGKLSSTAASDAHIERPQRRCLAVLARGSQDLCVDRSYGRRMYADAYSERLG